jgi:hypothetical protein
MICEHPPPPLDSNLHEAGSLCSLGGWGMNYAELLNE